MSECDKSPTGKHHHQKRHKQWPDKNGEPWIARRCNYCGDLTDKQEKKKI